MCNTEVGTQPCPIHRHLRVRLLEVLEENAGMNLCDLRLGGGFLHMTPKAEATKPPSELKTIEWTHVCVYVCCVF